MAAARFVIAGRVQGVGFRYATRAQALALGVLGHAVNRADGTVEVLAVGEPVALEALAAWLQRGPEHARVDRVERTDLDATPAGAGPGFATG